MGEWRLREDGGVFTTSRCREGACLPGGRNTAETPTGSFLLYRNQPLIRTCLFHAGLVQSASSTWILSEGILSVHSPCSHSPTPPLPLSLSLSLSPLSFSHSPVLLFLSILIYVLEPVLTNHHRDGFGRCKTRDDHRPRSRMDASIRAVGAERGPNDVTTLSTAPLHMIVDTPQWDPVLGRTCMYPAHRSSPEAQGQIGPIGGVPTCLSARPCICTLYCTCAIPS